MTTYTTHDVVCMLLRVAEEVNAGNIPVQATDPTEEAAVSQPMVETAASQPTVETAASQPMVETAASQPTVETAASQPMVETAASQPTVETAASQTVVSATASQPTEEIMQSSAMVEPMESTAMVEPRATQDLSRKRRAPDEPTDRGSDTDLHPVSADSSTGQPPKKEKKPRSKAHAALVSQGLEKARGKIPEWATLAEQMKEELLKLNPDAAPPPLTGRQGKKAGSLAFYIWYLFQVLSRRGVVKISPPEAGEHSFGGIAKIEITASNLDEFNSNPHVHVQLDDGHGGLSEKEIERMNKTVEARLKRVGMVGFLRGGSKTGKPESVNVGYRASDGVWVLTYNHATWDRFQEAHTTHRSTHSPEQAQDDEVQQPSVFSQGQPEASSVASAVQAGLQQALQNSSMVPLNIDELAKKIADQVCANLAARQQTGQQSNSLT